MFLILLFLISGCESTSTESRASNARKSKSLKISVSYSHDGTGEQLSHGVALALEEVNVFLPQGKMIIILQIKV